jgi:tRNA(Arg) A34 adenosine deaminase TadA
VALLALETGSGLSAQWRISERVAQAEIVALRSAASCLGGVDLSGSTLYTRWEPCPMCLAAVLVSKASTPVMGSRQSLGRWGLTP